MSAAAPQTLVVPQPELPARGFARLGPGWPLKLLILGFPLWWILGFSSFAFFVAAVAMTVDMVRRGRIRLPAGFGVWLLFLVWVLAGVTMLWATRQEPSKAVGLDDWSASATGCCGTWPSPSRCSTPSASRHGCFPGMTVVRWLSILFLFTAGGGLLGVLFPAFEFTSPMELIIPGAKADGFAHALVHPALAEQSDFLGYEQPRPKAPFAYPNAWGNNIGPAPTVLRPRLGYQQTALAAGGNARSSSCLH